MKRKIITSVILMLILGYITDTFPQISRGGKPYSFTHQLPSSIETKVMPPFDVETLLREDADTRKDVPYRFGYGFDVSYNLQNSGTWEKLPNGNKLWRLKILSKDAYSINLLYDKFWLPKGAEFFIYNSDTSMTIGAFTSRNNKPGGKFATGLVKGDEIIIEYYEPGNAKRPGEINISRVIHAYRNFFKNSNKAVGFGSSGACNNNVHCTVADDWQNQVRSVGMIVLGGGTRLCTGSLINNVKGNYAPYFLTANHCLVGDVETWVIWFNYESSTCANPVTEPTFQTISGATLKAHNSASDFALLMLSETPPIGYNVYYDGWSNVNAASSSTVCIHHPSGDIKKISFDDDQAISTEYLSDNYNISYSHWKVTWDDGTTERGSSGSPLFDSNHRVVGQLHGGYASCSNPDGSDWYGKFSKSWNYGYTVTSRLKDWLDPDNTGATVLNGLEDGMLTAGELPASATWSGSHTLTGDIMVPEDITLTIESGMTLNLNGHSIISTGGAIVNNGATINGLTTYLKSGSTIVGYCPSIQIAINLASSGLTIQAIASQAINTNLSIQSGRTLLVNSGAVLTFSSGKKLSIYGGGTFTANGATFKGNGTAGNWNSISFYSNSSGSIQNSTIKDALCGIYTTTNANVTVSNNTITNNSLYGLSIIQNSDVTVSDNTISNNGTGINVSTSDITINGNTIEDNTNYGINASNIDNDLYWYDNHIHPQLMQTARHGFSVELR